MLSTQLSIAQSQLTQAHTQSSTLQAAASALQRKLTAANTTAACRVLACWASGRRSADTAVAFARWRSAAAVNGAAVQTTVAQSAQREVAATRRRCVELESKVGCARTMLCRALLSICVVL